MICSDEMVKCVVLKELELTARELLGQKAVRDRVTRTDAEQHTATARFQKKGKYYEKQAAPRSTPVSCGESEGDRGDIAGTSGSGSGDGSS